MKLDLESISGMLDYIKTGIYASDAPVMLKENHHIEPASPGELGAFEEKIGEPLPEDYRTFLLENDIRHNFIGNFECLGLTGVVRTWEMMGRLLDEGAFDDGRVAYHLEAGFGNWAEGRIKQVWWSKKWIPVSEDGCGNLKCIDLDPGSNGIKYQLMQMEVQDGQGPYPYSFASFRSYLRYYLDALIMGDFVVADWGIEIVD